MKPLAFFPIAAVFLALFTPAQARLGETQEQSDLRYGTPVAADDGGRGGKKALLLGSKEISYNYQGWKIRVAIVGTTTARIEYSRPGESLTEKQVDAILDAEKGTLRWKEKEEKDEKFGKGRFPGRGGPGGREKQRAKEWSRTDKAEAKLTDRDSTIVIEGPGVGEREKKAAAANVPKF